MAMNEIHQPTPEFVSHLQWQVQTAMQRRDRFSEPVGQNRIPVLRMAALIMVSVLCGAAGVLAREQIQDIKNREMLLAEVEGRIQLSVMQLELARTRLEEVQEQFRNELVAEEAVQAATLKCREVETDVARLHLDREEISITGKEPDNNISAPLVGEKDFVSERLRLRMSVAQERATFAEKRMERVRTLSEAGLISAAEVAGIEAEFQDTANRLQYLQYQFMARQRFIEGEITGEEVENEVELNEAKTELDMQRLLLEKARNQFSRIEDLYENGLISEVELKHSRVELLEREFEIILLQMKLEQLISPPGQEPPPEG